MRTEEMGDSSGRLNGISVPALVMTGIPSNIRWLLKLWKREKTRVTPRDVIKNNKFISAIYILNANKIMTGV